MSKINLLPQEYIKQRLQYRVDMLCVLLFGMVMISIMTAEAISSRKVQEVQVTHAKINSRYQEVGVFAKEFFKLQNEKKSLLKEASIMEEMTDRIPRSYLLAMITNNCPEDITLTMIDIQENFIEEEVEEEKKPRRRRRATDENKDKKEEIKPPKIRLAIVLEGLATNIDLVTAMSGKYRMNPIIQNARVTETRVNRTAKGTLHEFDMVIVLKETDEVLKVMRQPEKLQQLVAMRAPETTSITAEFEEPSRDENVLQPLESQP